MSRRNSSAYIPILDDTGEVQSQHKKSRGLLERLQAPFSYGTFRTDKQREETSMVGGLSIYAFLNFISSGDSAGLQQFLQTNHVEIDDADEDGWTGLIHSVVQGNVESVKVFLDNGADVNKSDNLKCSPLLHAVKLDDKVLVSLLLHYGATVDSRDDELWTPLLVAAFTGSLEILTILLKKNPDVNFRGQHHCTSLLWSAGRGYTSLVDQLLRNGAKTEIGDRYGTTPLVWACRGGHTKVVSLLLAAGAKADTAGMYAWTPLTMAAQGNHTEIIGLLLRSPQNVNVTDQNGQTALSLACKEGNISIVQQLLGVGAYVNLQDRAGDTNLILATKAGNKQIVETLIKKYADINTKGKDGKTSLYCAVEKNFTSIVQLLLAANADVEIPCNEGLNPLIRAVKNKNVKIVQMLIEKKAKISVTDQCGDSPLHLAMRARSKAIVEILLRNPRHSQLLYKPNKLGETPYNIDLEHQKPILSQVFGARKLNTNEDSENMLGYDLYGSALADILSEPSLSMPITVGLYAKWGSGKSFLLKKLRKELKNFSRDWIDPTFQFSFIFFLYTFHVASILGLMAWLVDFHVNDNSFLGLTIVSFGTFLIVYGTVFGIHFTTSNTNMEFLHNLRLSMCRTFENLKLIVNVIFFNPPGHRHIQRNQGSKPLKLFFTDQTKVTTSAGGDNSVIQMIGSLYDSVETEYGSFTTRFYRALQPKPSKSTDPRRLKKICCVPYIIIYLLSYTLTIVLIVLGSLCMSGLQSSGDSLDISNQTSTTIKPENADRELDRTILYIILTLAILLAMILVSNIYSISHILWALVFSQRTHLQKTVANQDLVQSEGYLQAVKREITLLQSMVQCLDAFSNKQSRIIIIIDGLDSVEQKKVLKVLDTVHTLFSDPGSPFIILLAIDPHVIVKAIELNLNELFSETSIGGNSYLRNMVHLPFFLQNAGFRKIKAAQQLASKQLLEDFWEDDSSVHRKHSIESTDTVHSRLNMTRTQESVISPTSSVINMDNTAGPLEVNRMFLTDDYFSDVNPRSMRRLMNVIYVMGRLLKAFNIEFNWHHLASWTNITEQWPYRTSWITFYAEQCEERLDDDLPLKMVYDRVKSVIPSKHEEEPLLEMDRDEKKLDAFLSIHKKNLKVSDLKIFLPFTINLDPYLKKLIKEEVHNLEALGVPILSLEADPSNYTIPMPFLDPSNGSNITRRKSLSIARHYGQISFPSSKRKKMKPASVTKFSRAPHNFSGLENSFCYPSNYVASSDSRSHDELRSVYESVPAQYVDVRLAQLTVDDVANFLRLIPGISGDKLDAYEDTIRGNNINGMVLANCDINELRSVCNMGFGDWNLFKIQIINMRELAIKISLEKRSRASPDKIEEETNDELETKGKAKFLNESSVQKQVELEEEAVSGLLSIINENAREDIIKGEAENSIQETDTDVGKESDSLHQKGAQNLEVSHLYYSHNSHSFKDVEDLKRNESSRLIEDDSSKTSTEGRLPSRNSSRVWNSRSFSCDDPEKGIIRKSSTPRESVKEVNFEMIPLNPVKLTASKSKPTIMINNEKFMLDILERKDKSVNKDNEEEEGPYDWISNFERHDFRRHRSKSEGPEAHDLSTSSLIPRSLDETGSISSKTAWRKMRRKFSSRLKMSDDSSDTDGQTGD